MRNLFILILTFFTFIAGANTVTIKGTAGTYYHGQKLYLTQLQETFLGSKQTVAETEISLTGQFSVTLDCNAIQSVEFISAFVTFPFKIEAGATYTIELKNPSENEFVSIANTTVKEVLFYDLPTSDINYKIIDFNNTLDSLLDAELADFNPRSYTLQLAVFHQKFDNEPDYFRQYAQSAIASQLLNFERDKKLFFQNYILHNTLSLSISESTILLGKFYADAIENLIRFEANEVRGKIKAADGKAFYGMFQKWDFTPTPFLRDFAALSNAYNAYHDRFYTKSDLVELLKELRPLLTDPTVLIALDAIETELGLNFKSVLKPMVDKLDVDSKKKMIVLCFYSTKSEISIREMNELERLIQGQKLPIQIVKYCTDCTEYELNSDLGFALSKDPMVFSNLRLYSLPKFTLIDSKANILQEWLEPPSHGAERQLKMHLNLLGQP